MTLVSPSPTFDLSSFHAALDATRADALRLVADRQQILDRAMTAYELLSMAACEAEPEKRREMERRARGELRGVLARAREVEVLA